MNLKSGSIRFNFTRAESETGVNTHGVNPIFRRIFFDLLQMMSADWQDHTICNSRIMTKTANVAQRASRWIVGMQIFAVVTYSAGVLAANIDNPERVEPYERELILKMELPFNISTNSIYVAVQSVQFYHLFLVGCGITIINSLLVTLVSSTFARYIWRSIKSFKQDKSVRSFLTSFYIYFLDNIQIIIYDFSICKDIFK